MRIQVLASSSAGNAILVESDSGNRVLLDAGLPFTELRKRLSHQVASLDFALITHSHQDHCRAVPGLLKAGVDVYASEKAWEQMGGSEHHRAHTIPIGESEVGDWCITALPVDHDAPGTLAYDVLHNKSGDEALYITDTASFAGHAIYADDLFPTYVLIECNHRRADLELMAEFDRRTERVVKNHMSIEGCIEALGRLNLDDCEAIILLHLSGENSNEAAFIAEVAEATGKRVIAAPENGDGTWI